MEATESAPTGVACAPVFVEQPGNMLDELVRDVEHGRIRNHQGPLVAVLVKDGADGQADPAAGAPARGICNHLQNVVATSALFRAVLDSLDAWVSEGVEPPPSAVPIVADGTLVTMNAWSRQFPAVPSVLRPQGPNELYTVDRSAVPPVADRSRGYTVLVPAVDADGNETAGVRAPMVAVPLGTYTGWNTRAPGQGHGALHEFSGSTFPFAATEDERLITGDLRPSIQKRYRDSTDYVAMIKAAAEELVARRLLLEEDLERAPAAAADWSAPRHRFEQP